MSFLVTDALTSNVTLILGDEIPNIQLNKSVWSCSDLSEINKNNESFNKYICFVQFFYVLLYLLELPLVVFFSTF
jgi:hypothetical protein